jgi:hypothetical protein
MITKETDSLLVLMEKIERAISNIYGSFAVRDAFTDEARRFWASMIEAELEHAALFRNIREKASQDASVEVEIDINRERLQASYHKIKSIEKKVIANEIPASESYSIGAFIEEGLYEFSYSKRVASNSPDIMERIRQVEADTKQHYFLLHNYSLNGKGLFRRP